jgi:hypothetical protein
LIAAVRDGIVRLRAAIYRFDLRRVAARHKARGKAIAARRA